MNSHSPASRAGLAEDRVGHADLAEVVQLGGPDVIVHAFGGPCRAAARPAGEHGHVAGVLVERGLACMHAAHQDVASLGTDASARPRLLAYMRSSASWIA